MNISWEWVVFFLNSEADLDDWTIIKYNRPEFP